MKNNLVKKLFLLLNISDFSFFNVKTATPWKKLLPLSQQPSSRNQDPSSPTFLKIWPQAQPLPPAKRGRGAHYVVSKKIYIKQIKCKYLFYAASCVRSFSRWQHYILLMSYYTYFIHTIYLLKWFESNCFPMMLWLEHDVKAHCKLFTVQN